MHAQEVFMKKARTLVALLLLGLLLGTDALVQQLTTAKALFRLELAGPVLWVLIVVNALGTAGIALLCLTRTGKRSDFPL
jgi:hypothetical protein